MTPNFELLERIAAHTETIPPERFDIGTYFVRGECGSVGCSLGWYANDFPDSEIATHLVSNHLEAMGLTVCEYDELFYHYDPVVPATQAKRIRDFIAEKRAEACT